MNLENAKKMLSAIPTRYPIIVSAGYGSGKDTMIAAFAKENGFSMADIRLSQMTIGDIQGLETIDGYVTPYYWDKDILYFNELERGNSDIMHLLWNVMLDRQINEKKLRDDQRIIFGMNKEIYSTISLSRFDELFLNKTFIIEID